MSERLNGQEINLIDRLGDCWTDFLQLCKDHPECTHPQDTNEFCTSIHHLQEKIMSRVAVRIHKEYQQMQRIKESE